MAFIPIEKSGAVEDARRVLDEAAQRAGEERVGPLPFALVARLGAARLGGADAVAAVRRAVLAHEFSLPAAAAQPVVEQLDALAPPTDVPGPPYPSFSASR